MKAKHSVPCGGVTCIFARGSSKLLGYLETLLWAMVLGACIGIERQWRNSAAGLRTNTLVSVGAALFVLTGSLSGISDNSRIEAQIVSGIGFIGGGAILRDGLTIRGVNTAATLWCSAAVGTICGSGRLAQAGLACLVILFANLVLRPVSHRMMDKTLLMTGGETHYAFHFTCEEKNESRLRKLLLSAVGEELVLRSIKSQSTEPAGMLVVRSIIVSPKKNDHTVERLVGAVNEDPAVTEIGWEVLHQSGQPE